MATLSALLCRDVRDLKGVSAAVASLSTDGSLILRDATVVAWPVGGGHPEFGPAAELRCSTPMNQAFWHLLFGHVLLLPIAAAQAGVPVDGSSGSLASLGIRNEFLDAARRGLGPGSSALFLLTDDATVDRLLSLLPDLEFTVTSTNLSAGQLHGLQHAFTHHQDQGHTRTIA